MDLKNNHINYAEFKARDLDEIKKFYHQAFGWDFTDYGPTYVAFSESGLAGGFEKWDDPVVNGALIVLYHRDLEGIKDKIKEAGGKISKEIFSFPGGRRFHFTDPGGNELAVWSDQ
jgi:predicted enzyme related to lactoylglutathione lyase